MKPKTSWEDTYAFALAWMRRRAPQDLFKTTDLRDVLTENFPISTSYAYNLALTMIGFAIDVDKVIEKAKHGRYRRRA